MSIKSCGRHPVAGVERRVCSDHLIVYHLQMYADNSGGAQRDANSLDGNITALYTLSLPFKNSGRLASAHTLGMHHYNLECRLAEGRNF